MKRETDGNMVFTVYTGLYYVKKCKTSNESIYVKKVVCRNFFVVNEFIRFSNVNETKETNTHLHHTESYIHKKV